MKNTLLLLAYLTTLPLTPIIPTINQLTIEEKIGQLFIASAVSDETIAQDCIWRKAYPMDKEHIETLITHYHIGGVIFLGKSDTEKQKTQTMHYQSLSTIPLFIGQDLEPGRVGKARFTEFNFPSNQEIGAMANNEIAYHIGKKIGEICKSLGVNINFAPVADVNNNPNNPVINNRSFGDNPHTVAQKAIAFAKGLHDAGIIACAKHFPGHGDTSTDSHFGLPLIAHDKERLNTIELYPFKQLINTGIDAIMTAHLEVPALEKTEKLPATLSHAIITTLLKKDLGFKGLVITDALDMKGITNHFSPGEAAVKALLAGNDILLCCPDIPAAINAIQQALADGVITEKDINERVEKILMIKNIYCLS